ncbi:lactococcin 972 family bacteriocin [Lactobacillus sp. ESL0230]|nr:lactococcin 972 family bacteriocin [Lactobacillus sp. ESL0230]
MQSTYKHSSRNHTAAAKNANDDGRRDYARAGSTAFSKVNVAIKGNKFRG